MDEPVSSEPSTGKTNSILSLTFLTLFQSTFLVKSFGRPVTTRVLIALGSVDPAAAG